MADEAQQHQQHQHQQQTTTAHGIHSIHWRDVFPFTHLFRSFRVAVHPSKLILGLLGLLTLYVGGVALDSIWPSRHLALPDAPSDEGGVARSSPLNDASVRRESSARRPRPVDRRG